MTHSDAVEAFVKDSEERDQVAERATAWASNVHHLHQVATFSRVKFQQCPFCKVKPFHLEGFKACTKLEGMDPQKRRDLIAAARAKLNPPPVNTSQVIHEFSKEETFGPDDLHPDFGLDFQ